MRKLCSNQQGMTLVEVMMAAAMLGVISLGVAQIMSNMGKTMRWSESKSEEIELLNRFRMEVRDKLVCTHSLIGACRVRGRVGAFSSQQACIEGGGVWTPNTKSIGRITEIRSRNDAQIFAVGQEIGTGGGRVKIDAMEFLADGAPVPGQQGSAFISVRLERQALSGTGAGMSKKVTERVPLVVVWDATGTRITECYADRENTILTAKDEACQNIGGIFEQDNENWCRLLQKSNDTFPAVQVPTSSYPPPSQTIPVDNRAVSQQYVNQSLREACQGPGLVFQAPAGPNLTPRCVVDPGSLTASCPAGMVAKQITFSTTPPETPRLNGITNTNSLTLNPLTECVATCPLNQIFVQWDNNWNPVCRSCNTGEVLIWNSPREAPVCHKPWRSGAECANSTDGDKTLINVFDGRDLNTGAPICRTIMTYDNTECGPRSGQRVMIGIDFSTSRGETTAKPRCCKLGTGCPPADTLCANGYEGERDDCGFICPGTKVAKSIPIGQPLVFGCNSATDTSLVVTNFYQRECGGNTAQETTQTKRDCVLGKTNGNHTYTQCRAQSVGGVFGKVRFFSPVESGTRGQEKDFGNEEDSYCLLPQANNEQTYGRGSSSIVDGCYKSKNCSDVKTLNDSEVDVARGCPTGWKEATSFEGKFLYKVFETPCTCMNIIYAEGDQCQTIGQSANCTSGKIDSGVYYMTPGGSPSSWPMTFLRPSKSFYDTLTRTTNGSCDYTNWCWSSPATDPMAPTCTGSPARATFKCYAQIGGMSCR